MAYEINEGKNETHILYDIIKEVDDKYNYLMDQWIFSPPSRFLYIEEDGKVIAFLLFSYYEKLVNIHFIFISKNYRRKGLATKLIDCTKTRDILLASALDNPASFKLHHKLGFKMIGKVKDAITMIYTKNKEEDNETINTLKLALKSK